VAAALLLALGSAPLPLASRRDPAGADPALAALQAQVVAMAQAGGGRVGLAAIDLHSGRMVSVNGSEPFPMASTVKIAIAALFLAEVQDGRLSLDSYYALPGGRGAPQTGTELLERMMLVSSNRAADTLLHAVGGTGAVERWLAAAHVSGQRVDRSIAELLADRRSTERVMVGRGRHRRWISVAVPRPAVPGDRRDSSTPEAMAALLAKLRGGELLDGRRTAYLFDLMARCRTGANRIRGLLPPGTRVAHKTGTLDGVANDVGIVTLPNGHELALAVFEQGAAGPAAQDRNIAGLSRLLFDGFGAAPAISAGESSDTTRSP